MLPFVGTCLRRKNLVAAGFLLFTLLPSAKAEEFSLLRLEDAIASTLRENPQLHQFALSERRLLALRESSSLSPGFELEVELENFAGTGDLKTFDSAETTLALSSAIELGNKADARVSVRDAELGRLDYQKQADTLTILGEVTTAFIQCLSTQEKIDLAQNTVKLSESMLKTVKTRARRGAAPEAEVMRAKAALADANIRLNAYQQQFERQKVTLAIHWRETQPRFSRLTGKLFHFGESVSFPDLYQKAINSPAIAIFASESRLKEAELALARTQSRGNLQWEVGIKRLEESDDFAFSAGLSIPLFANKRNEGQLKAALIERDSVESQRDMRLLTLHSRLFSAYSQREQYIAAVDLMRSEALPALEKALALTQEAYESGRYRYQEWVAAQEALLNAKLTLIESAEAALLNQTLIEQLTAESLTP